MKTRFLLLLLLPLCSAAPFGPGGEDKKVDTKVNHIGTSGREDDHSAHDQRGTYDAVEELRKRIEAIEDYLKQNSNSRDGRDLNGDELEILNNMTPAIEILKSCGKDDHDYGTCNAVEIQNVSEDIEVTFGRIREGKIAVGGMLMRHFDRLKMEIDAAIEVAEEEITDELAGMDKIEVAKFVDGTCYADDHYRFLLDELVHYSATNSPDECIETCASRGYSYAGVQYSHECFCGNHEPPASRIRDSSQCRMKCPGDSRLYCGGDWKMNIYTAKTDPCLDKPCGAECDTSYGMLQVMRYCQPDGSCTPNAQPDCRGCPADHFSCLSGECIHQKGRCNGLKDCSDGSDEETCHDYVCPADKFKCSCGECINGEFRCDGDKDCKDGSDEYDCEDHDACLQRFAVEGTCEASIPSWSYNQAAGRCKEFNYGGCEGNDNRFTTYQECSDRCKTPDACLQIFALEGPCKASIPSWSYNQATGRCEEFKYGGCMGNANRFGTYQECSDRCKTPGTTAQPGGSTSVAPGGSTTVAPGGSTTVAPGGSTTVAPGGSTSVAPGGSTTVVPGGSTTVAPGGSTSVAPGGSTTVAPGGSTTVAPGGSTSVAPGGSTSAAPGGSTSAAPGGFTSAPPEVQWVRSTDKSTACDSVCNKEGKECYRPAIKTATLDSACSKLLELFPGKTCTLCNPLDSTNTYCFPGNPDDSSSVYYHTIFYDLVPGGSYTCQTIPDARVNSVCPCVSFTSAPPGSFTSAAPGSFTSAVPGSFTSAAPGSFTSAPPGTTTAAPTTTMASTTTAAITMASTTPITTPVTTTTMMAASTTAGCHGWLTFENSCYRLVTTPMDWTSARLHCLSLDADLASIHSSQEQDFVYSMIQNAGSIYIFIGGNNHLVQWQYKWSDGTTWDYYEWEESQPSDRDSDRVVGMHGGSGKWYNRPQNTKYPFVCKK